MIAWSHSKEEMFEMARIVTKTKARNFLEIGSYHFVMDMVYMFLSDINVDGGRPLMITIDEHDLNIPRRTLLSELFPKAFYFINDFSERASTIEKVKIILANEPLDVLFIDGNHSFAGVEADTNNYSPLISPDGYIIWHDAMTPRRQIHKYIYTKLGQMYPISVHAMDNSYIAYIKGSEWKEAEIRFKDFQEHPEKYRVNGTGAYVTAEES